MSDLEELRRLSEAATPGPWSTDRAMLVEFLDRSPQNATDFRFIVALVNAYRDGSLSNPTSSVSTEGVADEPHVALCGSKDTPHWHLFGADFDSVEQFDTEAKANAALARLTAINPDSPVEPDRG